MIIICNIHTDTKRADESKMFRGEKTKRSFTFLQMFQFFLLVALSMWITLLEATIVDIKKHFRGLCFTDIEDSCVMLSIRVVIDIVEDYTESFGKVTEVFSRADNKVV